MSVHQEASIQDRLARRRRVRNKTFLKNNTTDDTEIIAINHSPKTQSLDRKSTAKSFDQHKSSTIVKSSELPIIEKSHLKQTDVLSNHQTPLQTQVTEHQYSNNDKQIPAKSLATYERTQDSPHPVDKPVITNEIVSKPIPEKSLATYERTQDSSYPVDKPVISKEIVSKPIVENYHVSQDEKPIVIKETITPTLPTTTGENVYLIPRETRGYSTPNQIKTFEDHPKSTIDHPLFHPKSITRTTSEQIVSMATKYTHQPVGSIFAKQNSLALPYLFNKRLIDAEIARASSLDSEQSHRRTVWD
jgi:hypothetical protein